MDHLPYPKNPTLPPIDIPYMCQDIETYDGLGFTTFPSRMGWTSHTGQVQWYECEADTAAGRAQSWLYFGLLQEVLGDDFDRTTFLRQDSGPQRSRVVSERLSVLLHNWSVETSVFGRQRTLQTLLWQRYSIYHRFLVYILNRWSSLKFARYILSKVEPPLEPRLLECLVEAESQVQSLELRAPSVEVISLSIMTLLWSLRNTMANCEPKLRKNRGESSAPQNRLLRERMISGGKCPYWTEVYLKRYSIPMINYIAALPNLGNDGQHESCTSDRCQANIIDEKEYKTTHIHDDCSCSSAGVDVEEMVSLFQADSTPLLQLTEYPDRRLYLEVREADFKLPYTAISHVWSGGLGNPKRNELPQCQLRRIYDQLSLCRDKAILHIPYNFISMFSSPYRAILPGWIRFLTPWLRHPLVPIQRDGPLVFWMDTLCIPVGDVYKPLQRKAIRRMDFIYSGAESILILDSELRNSMGSDMSILQRRVHMMCCSWMTRCWTYQEARLSRDWAFPFLDNLYEPVRDYIRERDVKRLIVRSRVVWNDARELQLEAISFVERLWPLTNKRLDADMGDEIVEFICIWQQLSERSTTKLEDLNAIFAVLLGLDPSEILELEPEERMKAIFRTQQSIPVSLLYTKSHVPAADDYKNRWIPQYPSGQINSDYGCLKRTVDGKAYTFKMMANSCAFILPQSLPACSMIRFRDFTSPSAPSIQVHHDAEPADRFSQLSSENAICYLLYDCPGSKDLDERIARQGGKFYVLGPNTSGTCRLMFDCHITYTASVEQDVINRSSVDRDGSPLFVGELVDRATSFLLDCDLDTWYEPKYDRMATLRARKGQGLNTMPWYMLAGHFINAIWISILAAAAKAATDVGKDTLGHLRGFILPVTLTTIGYVSRLTLFAFWEMPFLQQTTREFEYRKWAKTFASSKGASAVGKTSSRFTYQYRPWWVAIIIWLSGAFLAIFSFVVRAMFCIRFVGLALVFETTLRLLLEVLWRRNLWIRTHFTSLWFRYYPSRLHDLKWSIRGSTSHPLMTRASVDNLVQTVHPWMNQASLNNVE